MPARLTIVGTGIRLGGQLTLEAMSAIQTATAVFYLVGNPAFGVWMKRLNPAAVSLHSCYGEDKPREESYAEMVEMILAPLSQDCPVCAAFYGHPGVGVDPAHEVMRLAKARGIPARMLPGVSAEACLYADLGFDPLTHGCQSYEATDFIARRPVVATSAALLLWQIGIVGERHARFDEAANAGGLEMLTDALKQHYPDHHEVVVYEAATYPVCEPTIERVPLGLLPRTPVTRVSSLLVPPIDSERAT